MTEQPFTAGEKAALYEKLGNHGARLTMVEGWNNERRQDIVNVRAEVNGLVAEHKVETHDYIHRIEAKIEAAEVKMEAIWDSIALKLGTLQKFQWTILIGGGVITTMVGGLVIISWQILVHIKLFVY